MSVQQQIPVSNKWTSSPLSYMQNRQERFMNTSEIGYSTGSQSAGPRIYSAVRKCFPYLFWTVVYLITYYLLPIEVRGWICLVNWKACRTVRSGLNVLSRHSLWKTEKNHENGYPVPGSDSNILPPDYKARPGVAWAVVSSTLMALCQYQKLGM